MRRLWGGPLPSARAVSTEAGQRVGDAVGGKQPEVPGPRTPLYPRAHRTRDTIDAHFRSAAGVSLFTSTRSDTTRSRVWVTTIRSPVVETTPPTPAPSGRAVRCRHPDSQVAGSPQHAVVALPFEGVPGGNTPQTVFGPLTNTTQKPTSRFTAREGPLMTPTPHGRQFAQHPHARAIAHIDHPPSASTHALRIPPVPTSGVGPPSPRCRISHTAAWKGGPTRSRTFAYRRWGCSHGRRIGDGTGWWVRNHLWYRVASW